jgi:hypothetical protein
MTAIVAPDPKSNRAQASQTTNARNFALRRLSELSPEPDLEAVDHEAG